MVKGQRPHDDQGDDALTLEVLITRILFVMIMPSCNMHNGLTFCDIYVLLKRAWIIKLEFLQAYQQVNYPQMLRGSLWIFVDICGYLWIFVDICGYSIQSYLHAGRPFS